MTKQQLETFDGPLTDLSLEELQKLYVMRCKGTARATRYSSDEILDEIAGCVGQ
jgi:hypothetical protein